MRKIVSDTKNISDIASALKGVYDSGTIKNGIRYVINGKIAYFEGFIDNSPRTLEIPILPVMAIVTFGMVSGWTLVSISEANSGLVKVPEQLWGKSYCVFCTCIVNSL